MPSILPSSRRRLAMLRRSGASRDEIARSREIYREDRIAYNSPKATLHFSKPLDEMQLGIVKSILGQLSDGMWENSREMQKYWKGVRVTAQGIDYPEPLKGKITGPFYAKLLSRIVAEERKNTPGAGRNKEHIYEYLSRGDSHQPKINEINELIKILKATHH